MIASYIGNDMVILGEPYYPTGVHKTVKVAIGNGGEFMCYQGMPKSERIWRILSQDS